MKSSDGELLKSRKDLFLEAQAGGHSTKELSIIRLGSQKILQWRGACGHVWPARVKDRTKRGTGCPVCSGRTTLSGFNDLQTLFPEIAAQWHPTLNGKLTPNQVSAGTHSRAWWLGPCKHVWHAQIKSRTYGGRGCGFCQGRAVLQGFNDLATTHPQIAKYVSPNSQINVKDVSFGSKKVLLWKFGCGHQFDSPVFEVVGGARCPYCSGNRILKGFNDLESNFPQLAKEWHQSRNGSLKPNEVTVASSRKVYWSASCGHTWQAIISNRTKFGHRCSVCAGKTVVTGVNDVATVFPQLLNEWDYKKNEFQPQELTWGTRKNIYFLCELGHSYKSNPATKVKRGLGCAYCAFRKLLPGFNDFETVCPEAASEWDHTKNKHGPGEFLPGSQEKFWFVCKNGHSWPASLFSRYHTQTGCPSCAITGFNPLKPGLIYFLRNDELRSFKVGITNKDAKANRIAAFQSRNWELIFTWELSRGHVAYEVEKIFFLWLRNEIGLPPSATKDQLQGMSGFTETFQMGVITEEVIKGKISKLVGSAA